MVMQVQRSVKNVRRRPKRTNYVERVRECERGFEPHRTRGFGGFSRRSHALFGSYGGLLDKCNLTSEKYTSALQLFSMSIIQGDDVAGHSISSDPTHTQLCFCNMTKPDCSVESQSRSIYPGQRVEFSAIAIDQSLSGIPTLIHTARHSGQNVTDTLHIKQEKTVP